MNRRAFFKRVATTAAAVTAAGSVPSYLDMPRQPTVYWPYGLPICSGGPYGPPISDIEQYGRQFYGVTISG